MKIKKNRLKTNLRFQFTLIVLVEIGLSILIAFFLVHEFTNMGSERILFPLTLWQILLSILIGGTIFDFVIKWVFNPIDKLGRAMSKVADGDFSIKLETNSGIDEIRSLYSDFNVMVKELNNTEILQTDFISNVSHEFKTPISAIEGYAMLLQDESCSAEERKAYTDKILFNTDRLSELVANVLLLSKLDNQAIISKKKRFRLDEQIRQSILLLEPEWSSKDIDFDVELEELELTGNEGILIHVWDNVIGNAVKFSPSEGYVGIRLEDMGSCFRILVEDSGQGIKDKDKMHIFDRFYQGESSRGEKGNGLGLALAKKIVDMYGGRIWVEDREQGGSRFMIELPIKAA